MTIRFPIYKTVETTSLTHSYPFQSHIIEAFSQEMFALELIYQPLIMSPSASLQGRFAGETQP